MQNQTENPVGDTPGNPEEKPDFKTRLKEYWRKKWLRWTVIGLAGLFVVWCVVGFFALPGIIKSKAQDFVAEKFHRTVDFQDVSFNPLTLTVTMDGLHLSEPNSKEDFASFDHLVVNASIESVFRLSPVIEEVQLGKPVIHVIRTGANHYNFDDFIAFALKPEKDKKPTYFSVNNIQITNGTITFDDQPKGRKHLVDALNLNIPFVSNMPSYVDVFIDLDLNANVNQEKFVLDGKARAFTKNKDGSLGIKLDSLNLPDYMEYAPFKPNFVMKSGRLGIDAKVGFMKPETGEMALTVSGNMLLNNLVLNELSGKPVVNLPQMTLDLEESDLLRGDINIAELALKQPDIKVVRSASGVMNVEQMAKLTPIAGAYSGYVPTIPGQPADAAVAPATDETALDEESSSSSSSGMIINMKKFVLDGAVIKVDDGMKQIPEDFGMKDLSLQIDDVHVDLGERNATVEKVLSEKVNLRFDLKATPEDARKKAHDTVRKVAKAASGAFGFTVNRIDLKDWTVNFNSVFSKKKVPVLVTDLNVGADGLSSDFSHPSQVTVTATVNKRGKLDVKGSVALSPLKADLNLNVKNVDVSFIQTFIDDKVNMVIKRADLSAQGRAQLLKNGDTLKGSFNGNASVDHVVTIDQITGEAFVDWNVMKLNGVRATLDPMNVVVNQVVLDKFFARLILRESGVLNVRDILTSTAGGRRSLTRADEGLPFENADEGPKPDSENAVKTPPISAVMSPHDAAPDETSDEAAPAYTRAEPATPPNYSLFVKKFVLTNGRVRFTDNFIRPHYTANLMSLNGTVTDISTKADTQSSISVKGKVNGAPLVIGGRANLLSEKLSLDLACSVKGMELAQFSSYSGKYIGYAIQKGKLSFDVRYRIEDRQLKADNQLILDQLTLGREVKGTPILNVPIRLALALLKDRHGVIDLNLPVGGSLDDPQFSVGGIVLKVIVNVLTKAVTAPFSLLASLVGGSDVELSHVMFDPGQAVIGPAQTKVLETMVKALNERPALKLEITGKYDREADAIGIGKQKILRKIREMKRKSTGLTEADKVTLTDAEYADGVRTLYRKESFEKPTNWIGMNKSLPTDQMELLLAKHYAKSATFDDFIKLANKRSLAVKEWLLEKGKVPDERLFVLQSNHEGDAANRVEFSLQ